MLEAEQETETASDSLDHALTGAPTHVLGQGGDIPLASRFRALRSWAGGWLSASVPGWGSGSSDDGSSYTAQLEDLDVPYATFSPPDLTVFCRLDELGLVAVGQRLGPDRAVK